MPLGFWKLAPQGLEKMRKATVKIRRNPPLLILPLIQILHIFYLEWEEWTEEEETDWESESEDEKEKVVISLISFPTTETPLP